MVFLLVAFVVFLILGMLCWFAVVVSLIGVFRNFENNSDRFSARTMWNPLNALLNPVLLTDRGLLWRQRAFRGAIGFVIFCGTGALTGLCAKLLYAR